MKMIGEECTYPILCITAPPSSAPQSHPSPNTTKCNVDAKMMMFGEKFHEDGNLKSILLKTGSQSECEDDVQKEIENVLPPSGSVLNPYLY